MPNGTIETDAWVLYPANQNGHHGLVRERFEFSNITEDEVLVEPLFGCWEGNMSHALDRRPVDICRQRDEPRVVIGNAGVVRVLRPGSAIDDLAEGDICLVFCNGIWDERGFPKKIYAYDAPGSIGLLARRTKLHRQQLIRLPDDTRFTYPQWAAFSLRYITAWANWRAAYGCWRLHLTADEQDLRPIVWGWGGGVTYAELTLAALQGADTAMMSSDDQRLELIRESGIEPIDRRQFPNLAYDPKRYRSDEAYRAAYIDSENAFLELVARKTGGRGVSILVDFIGLPVFRATLKSLGRSGVVTTAGWKEGMNLSTVRALECMSWHTHVHTHYARYPEALEAVDYAERAGWMAPVNGHATDWDELPSLAEDHAAGRLTSYFPIFRVNPV
ncbi:MAG: zinc-binding alcohol dehydrogenase family protein [Acidobacteriota bacterium]